MEDKLTLKVDKATFAKILKGLSNLSWADANDVMVDLGQQFQEQEEKKKKK